MELRIDPKNQKYYAVWRSEELGNRESALLVIRPVRLFRPKTEAGVKIKVFPTSDFTPQSVGTRLPEGLYEYCLADLETQSALVEYKRVCIGAKKQITVEQVHTGRKFCSFRLCSPLALQAGDCLLSYPDIGIQVPLPKTTLNGDKHTADFLLRQRLTVKLCMADGVREMFDLSAARLF